VFLLSAGCFLQVLIRCGIRPLAPMIFWLAIAWLAPLLADAIRYNLADDHTAILQSLSTCSPLGALIQIWTVTEPRFGPVSTNLGITVQALVAIVFLLLDLQTKRSRKAARSY
jgi:hypothetical protein